jgi:GT2 family glycosyltransferase
MGLENKNNTILIIAVIYNSFNDTIRYIKSLEKFEEKNIKLILADNSEISPDSNFITLLKSTKLNIDYFKIWKNLGYFGGAKLSFDNYIKSNSLPQWVIISNVDIEFDDEKFFKFLEKLNDKNNLGVVAPAIISKTWGVDLNPKILKRYSINKLYFYKFITSVSLIQNFYILLGYAKRYLLYISNKLRKTKETKINNVPEKIYAPHGSCIILHRNYFERKGTLNHISFLFGEEIFIAENAIKNNLDIIYYPELKLLDYEHTSTGFLYSRKISRLMHISTIDIIENYYK